MHHKSSTIWEISKNAKKAIIMLYEIKFTHKEKHRGAAPVC